MFGRYVTLFSVLSLIAACGESSSRLEVPFVANFAGAPLSCQGSDSINLTDLRFYVHNLRLIDADGEEHPLRLAANDWQNSDLALLDLEDGTANCLNGTTPVNTMAVGTITGSDLRGLKFTLGVPFASNHGDPLKADAPLGDPDMHWHWRGGYKFFRAGIKSEQDSFWIHLGSTGCEGTIQNIIGCNSPNRTDVYLENFVPGDSVTVDLAALVTGDIFHDGEASDCSSGPAESSCVGAFAAFGLDHATGDTTGTQHVFATQSAR